VYKPKLLEVPQDIQNAVLATFGCTWKEIGEMGQEADAAHIGWMVMRILRDGQMPLCKIAKSVRKHQSTVINGLRRHEERISHLEGDPEYKVSFDAFMGEYRRITEST
jgi:hypothetical protein